MEKRRIFVLLFFKSSNESRDPLLRRAAVRSSPCLLPRATSRSQRWCGKAEERIVAISPRGGLDPLELVLGWIS